MKHFSPSAPLLAVLLLSLSAAPVVRAAADPYAGALWTPLDTKAEMAAATGITLAKYPDCDEATVDEHIVETYKADGTALNQDEAYVKVLTEKGKQNRRTLSLGFLLPYFTVEVSKLEVIKPNGQVIPVDVAANSTVTIDDSQMDENIYDPNSKVLQINLPDLEIGDVVHWITHITTMRSFMPGEFADENEFEGTGFIRHTTWEVHAPADKPLKKIVLKDEIPGTVKYTTQTGPDGGLIHRWEVNNVPRMFDEPSMPPYENILQRVVVSTTPDWQHVSKWYWDLSKPHLDAISPDLVKTVQQLTAGVKTPEDKARAVFYYVSQKIRYMGLTPEHNRPGFEPHDVCLTFDKKYGVCRDKAALLVAMLRAAGIEAYPVLVNVGSKKDQEVPDANFNHAIVGVEFTKGQYTLLDPTDEHAREFQPYYDGDQSYLVARPEGEVIRRSSFQPPEENLMRIVTTGTLSASGHLEAKSVLGFDGVNDDVYRNEFASMKDDDIRRYFEEHLKQAMPGAKLVSLHLTPENMLEITTPIKAEMEFSVDGMAATGHGKSVVSVPWIGNDLGIVTHILDGMGLDKRRYPMQTRVACGLDERISLKLSDTSATVESLPACPPVDDPSVSYHQSFDAKEGLLTCSRQLNLRQVEIAPDQYPKLKQVLKELQYDARKSPVLAVVDHPASAPDPAARSSAMDPVESNSIVLFSHKELDVADAHNAVLHVHFARKILTYAGKIRQAEIKLEVPAFETARIVHAVVTSKTGEQQEISKGEINLMDADEDASARRYPAGKILVANLPGVDIGSTMDVEYEVTMKDMPYVAGFEPFQLPDDVQEKTFKVVAPGNIPVSSLVAGGAAVSGTASSASGTQTFQWTAKNIAALPAESELPPEWVYKPGVSYFVGDFNGYLKNLNAILLDRSRSGMQAARLAHQLASGTKNRLEIVQAIRDYVATSIRDAGPAFNKLPLSSLSSADTTLSDGYGHAADRAILLHAMLTAADFKPRFVLASDLPAVPTVKSSFPQPDSYNTVLVSVPVDGQTYYLNDTDEYSRLGSTPHDQRLGINLASGTTQVIAAAQNCRDRIETRYTLSFADDGGLRMGVTKSYFGNEYNKKNRYFSELRPEEKKRYYQDTISQIGQGARPLGDLMEDFNGYPGKEKFSVALDNYAVVDGKYLYFNLPFTPSLIKLPGEDRRTLPYMLSHAGSNSVRTEIDLPLGFRNVLIAPGSESLDAPSGGGKVRVTSSASSGRFIMTDESETTPALISPNDYPAMVNLESTLENKSAKVFLLKKE